MNIEYLDRAHLYDEPLVSGHVLSIVTNTGARRSLDVSGR